MNKLKQIRHYTLVEILTVISIISILAGMLFPALQNARERGRFGRWLGYKSNLRSDPDLLVYYDFMDVGDPKLQNKAFGLDWDGYKKDKLDATINDAQWGRGRWRGKGAMLFNGGASCLQIYSNNSVGYVGPELTMIAWIYAYTLDNDGIICQCEDDTSTLVISGKKTTTSANETVTLSFTGNQLQLIRLEQKLDIPRGWIIGRGHGWGRVNNLKRFNKVTENTTTFDYTFDTETWYMVAITYSYEKEILKFYVNGQLEQELAQKDAIYCYWGQAWLGGINLMGETFNGIIDEFALFSREMTAQQVFNFYSMGRP